MTDQPPPSLLAHGAEQLSLVTVEAYNAELRSSEGFVGDRASKRAFVAIVDDWRARVRQSGEDPFGDTPTAEISKKQLDKVMAQGDAEAAGIIQGAIEEFSQEFAQVIRRFLRLKNWKDVQRIAVGAGCGKAASASSPSVAPPSYSKPVVSKSISNRFSTSRITPAWSAACNSCLPGFSPVTTASSPSTLVEATSEPGLSS